MMEVFFAIVVASVLDHRFGWLPVSCWVSLIGDALVTFSFLAIFWVLYINSLAAANVGVEGAQPVIDTGTYAYVRHPMYALAIWLCVGIPLALGTWWEIALVIVFFPLLAWRMIDEERILHRDLPGYTAYTQKVRSRLIPGIW